MTSSNNKYSNIKAIFEDLPKTLKSIGIVGSLCGFFYLFAYTREANIPFPLELSVLPSVLLLIGAVSILGTALVFSGVLAPAILADDPITGAVLLATDVKKPGGFTRFKRYVICCWAPMASSLLGVFLLVGMLNIGYWGKVGASTFCIAVSLGSVIFVSRKVVTQENIRSEYIVTIIAQTALSVLAYLLALTILLVFIPEIAEWPTWKAFLVVLIPFSVLHILVTMPNLGSAGKRILLPPHYEFKATPATATAFGILAIFVTASVLIYPVNAKIGRAVLFAFGVGGGIPAIICLKEAASSQVSQRITFDDNKCSEPVAVLFDAGDRLYASKHFFIPEDNAQDDSPVAEPIYFRQDQILQKIYLPTIKQKSKNNSEP